MFWPNQKMRNPFTVDQPIWVVTPPYTWPTKVSSMWMGSITVTATLNPFQGGQCTGHFNVTIPCIEFLAWQAGNSLDDSSSSLNVSYVTICSSFTTPSTPSVEVSAAIFQYDNPSAESELTSIHALISPRNPDKPPEHCLGHRKKIEKTVWYRLQFLYRDVHVKDIPLK